jgi:hypothetical protein
MVAFQRGCLFDEIADGKIKLNEFGKIVADTWKWLVDQCPYFDELHG